MNAPRKNIEQWLKSGRYLPEPMRDFHDQKDLFKAMHEIVDVPVNEYAKGVDWVSGHCYVIDIFLWFMARRGYTLQRSRQPMPFRDLYTDVAAAKKVRDDRYTEELQRYLPAADDAMVMAACKANMHPLAEPSHVEKIKMRASLEAAFAIANERGE